MTGFKYSKLYADEVGIEPAINLEKLHPSFCTGKTLGEILSLLSKCFLNPETPVRLLDCFGPNYRWSGRELGKLKEVIDKLDLKYFKFSKCDMYLTYEPYGYAIKDWVEVKG